jgi:hypothetical protein
MTFDARTGGAICGEQDRRSSMSRHNDVDTFHHLGIVSRDMADAIHQYERLGFVFAPLSLPKIPLRAGSAPEPLGVGNRCAIFQNNYLEILAVVDAERWASIGADQRGPFDIDRPLARYEGLHVMHFNAPDLDALRARLERTGQHPSAIRPFQRMVETADGPQLMRARSLSFPAEADPEALLQIAQHHTRELVLQPRFMQHPNGARSISEAIVCATNPEAVATKYSAYTSGHVRRNASITIVDLDSARIVVVDPAHLEMVLPGHTAPAVPCVAGFTVTADLDLASGALEQQGVRAERHGGRILVHARDACGSAVLFERVGAQR